MSSEGHKLGKVCAEALQIMRIHPGKLEGRAMRSFDPQTLLLLETAFDEAWLTLKSFGNNTVKPGSGLFELWSGLFFKSGFAASSRKRLAFATFHCFCVHFETSSIFIVDVSAGLGAC